MKVRLLKSLYNIPFGTIVEVKKYKDFFSTYNHPVTVWQVINPEKYLIKDNLVFSFIPKYTIDQADFEILD